jgi:hypothetical protein
MVLLNDLQQYRWRCSHREMPRDMAKSITELNYPNGSGAMSIAAKRK